MDKAKQIKRLTRNAIMLALMCIVGMFSIPLGTNIKVSLQLLMVFIIGLTSASFIDTLIITSLYLVIGLFVPVYAGFSASVSPTFGFVISFVVLSFPLYLLNKLSNIIYSTLSFTSERVSSRIIIVLSSTNDLAKKINCLSPPDNSFSPPYK